MKSVATHPSCVPLITPTSPYTHTKRDPSPDALEFILGVEWLGLRETNMMDTGVGVESRGRKGFGVDWMI